MKDGAARHAPPTRKPSMSGHAASVDAFLSFTEPPYLMASSRRHGMMTPRAPQFHADDSKTYAIYHNMSTYWIRMPSAASALAFAAIQVRMSAHVSYVVDKVRVSDLGAVPSHGETMRGVSYG